MNENKKTALEESLEKELGRMLLTYAKELKADWESVLEKKAVVMIEEIAAIIQGAEAYPDDQQLVEDIMAVLQRNGISTGVCHEY